VRPTVAVAKIKGGPQMAIKKRKTEHAAYSTDGHASLLKRVRTTKKKSKKRKLKKKR
jgi:hypothetical protein